MAQQLILDGMPASPGAGINRVLITVSRSWTDLTTIRRVITGHYQSGDVLISGHCEQGDQQVEEIWRELGGTVLEMPADWDRYGKAAGFRRNAEMVRVGARVCVAFAGPCRKPGCRLAGLPGSAFSDAAALDVMLRAGVAADEDEPHVSHGAADTATLAWRAGIPVDPHLRAGRWA